MFLRGGTALRGTTFFATTFSLFVKAVVWLQSSSDLASSNQDLWSELLLKTAKLETPTNIVSQLTSNNVPCWRCGLAAAFDLAVSSGLRLQAVASAALDGQAAPQQYEEF